MGRRETRRALGLPGGATVILAGALTWEKDPLVQLDLSTAALEQQENTFHIFAGDGPMRSDVQRAVSQRGIGDRVLILGSRNDAADLFAASDVLGIRNPSRRYGGDARESHRSGDERHPGGRVHVAGASEVVVDGETGFLVPWADTTGLERRLHQLLADPDLREAMGKAARGRCRSMFSIDVIAPRYLDLYEGLVGRQRVPATDVR